MINPSNDTLSEKNRTLARDEIAAEHKDLPPVRATGDPDSLVITLVLQYEPWKDQFGMTKANRQIEGASRPSD